MPTDIIQTQKEVARKLFDTPSFSRAFEAEKLATITGRLPQYDGTIATEELDTLIATIIANIGRELEARCEGEKRKHNCPPDDGNDYDHGAWVAYDRTLTIIRSITGISPTR